MPGKYLREVRLDEGCDVDDVDEVDEACTDPRCPVPMLRQKFCNSIGFTTPNGAKTIQY